MMNTAEPTLRLDQHRGTDPLAWLKSPLGRLDVKDPDLAACVSWIQSPTSLNTGRGATAVAASFMKAAAVATTVPDEQLGVQLPGEKRLVVNKTPEGTLKAIADFLEGALTAESAQVKQALGEPLRVTCFVDFVPIHLEVLVAVVSARTIVRLRDMGRTDVVRYTQLAVRLQEHLGLVNPEACKAPTLLDFEEDFDEAETSAGESDGSDSPCESAALKRAKALLELAVAAPSTARARAEQIETLQALAQLAEQCPKCRAWLRLALTGPESAQLLGPGTPTAESLLLSSFLYDTAPKDGVSSTQQDSSRQLK